MCVRGGVGWEGVQGGRGGVKRMLEEMYIR